MKDYMNLKEEVEHISSGKLKIYTGNPTWRSLLKNSNSLCKSGALRYCHGHQRTHRLGKNNVWKYYSYRYSSSEMARHLCSPGKQFGTGIKKIGLVSDFKDVIHTIPTQFIKQFIDEFHPSCMC